MLVVAVVAFASSGRRFAAALSAVAAAAGFNLFHTEPYLSLRISSGDDVETAALLLVVGLIVGELALRGRRGASAGGQGAARPGLAEEPGRARRRRRGPELRPARHRLGAHPPPRLGRLPVRVRSGTGADPAGRAPRRLRPMGTDSLGHRPVGSADRGRRDPRLVARPTPGAVRARRAGRSPCRGRSAGAGGRARRPGRRIAHRGGQGGLSRDRAEGRAPWYRPTGDTQPTTLATTMCGQPHLSSGRGTGWRVQSESTSTSGL